MNKKRLIDYLSGRLSNREKNRLEREAHADPFDAEAFEGLSRLTANELEHDLNLLSNRISQHQKRRIRLMPLLIRVAAILILLLVPATVVWLFLKNEPVQELAKSKSAPMSVDSVNQKALSADTAAKIVIADNSLKPPEHNTIRFTPPVIKLDEQVADDEEIGDKSESLRAAESVSVTDYDMGTDDVLVPVLDEPQAQSVPVLKDANNDSAAVMVLAKGEKKRSLSAGQAGKTINGTIVDENGEPLIGVSLLIKGTTVGTISDIDGKYSLKVPENVAKPVIEVSFIGYNSEELAVQSDSVVQIAMKPDQLAMNEVVVIGYGVAKTEEQEPSLTLARPVIGMHQYEQNLSKAVVFPAGEVKQKQVVVLRLTIDEGGNITNIVVIKSPGKAFEEEAIRAVKAAGSWMAAHKGSEYIETNRRVRVLFNPDAD
jgi:TonB family protein